MVTKIKEKRGTGDVDAAQFLWGARVGFEIGPRKKSEGGGNRLSLYIMGGL